MKQNIAFGLMLNANHVSTAERDAIRGHYIKGWAEANDSIVARARKRWRIFRKGHHKQTPMADITDVVQGSEDAHVQGLETHVFRWDLSRTELATTIDRFLHGQRRHQGLHAREQVL
ncbi:hypothetical protein WI560_12245 [Bradyrhizobium sp. A11]|uniref:hypothetical protein n=1 Tax=Bradyrhizobium sp. A11 TaxID=3133974 RepID=UPI0032548CC5